MIGKGWRQGKPGAHGFELRLQKQRLGQFVGALFQRGHLLRVLGGYIVLFARILRDVIEFDSLRQRGAPNELPIALADVCAERLDVVDRFAVRGEGLPSLAQASAWVCSLDILRRVIPAEFRPEGP